MILTISWPTLPTLVPCLSGSLQSPAAVGSPLPFVSAYALPTTRVKGRLILLQSRACVLSFFGQGVGSRIAPCLTPSLSPVTPSHYYSLAIPRLGTGLK